MNDNEADILEDKMELDAEISNAMDQDDSIEVTQSKKASKKSNQKKSIKEEEIKIEDPIPMESNEVDIKPRAEMPPPPVLPPTIKKTRNRKKINTKTIKRIQRFF